MNIINKLTIGTVQFGLDYGINNSGGKVSAKEVYKILDIAFNNGIYTLDTSAAYGDSESIIGGILSDSKLHFNIISKYPQSSNKVKDIFKQSLSELHQSQIYGYLIHHFEYYKLHPEIWEEMLVLKDSGLVSKIGFSLYEINQLEYLIENDVKLDILQIPYNILDRQFEPFFEELSYNNIEIHTRSVFLQGLFFKPVKQMPQKLTPLIPYLEEITHFCIEKGIEKEELAINAIIHNPLINNLLIGVDGVNQLIKNITCIWDKIPEDISKFVETIDVKEKNLLNPVNWNK